MIFCVPSGTRICQLTRGARVVLERGDDVDRRLRRLALAQPAQRGALRIEIHEHRVVAARGEVRREVDRERRLAGTPFGVQDDDALHDAPLLCLSECGF